MVELSDNVLVAASGDQGDVEMFVEWLKVTRMMCSHTHTRYQCFEFSGDAIGDPEGRGARSDRPVS